jgi:ribose-phosphate pyrophosphokinase
MLIYAYPSNETFADQLATALAADRGRCDWHSFPDGETLVRIDTPPAGGDACIVCTLAEPDSKILPLVFAAATLRELGAKRVGLVAPYLAYMRQDMRFHAGEALSSCHFARLLSRYFDWLVTVDPHLHRYHSLDEIFTLSSQVVHAAPALAEWIAAHVERPLLVGPDAESAQWVADVAARIGAPWIALQKERLGDRHVRVTLPDVEAWHDRIPVLVDDILSTGHTVMAATVQLVQAGMSAPLCVAVHGLFQDEAREQLLAAGITRVVTTNTILLPEAAIDMVSAVADGVRVVLKARPREPAA